nr:MAPEG family protein [Phormidium sp. LEGE 05292]
MGCRGLLALGLSYQVVMERTRTRIWHGSTTAEVALQPDYLKDPNAWAAFVEKLTQKTVVTKEADDGVLQRKIRAYGNFTEYVPIGLLFSIALELMQASTGLIWMLGAIDISNKECRDVACKVSTKVSDNATLYFWRCLMLIVGRIAHAWGLIQIYGLSPGRAIGFFGTWLVYIIGSIACLYYSVQQF